MKRLLRISLNAAIFSFIPVISWFALGLIVDRNLTNVFTLTYPIQFIWGVLNATFGTGANIAKEKDKNENAVLSGMTLGIIVGFIIFGILLLNIEKYIKFMSMDIGIYKEFAIYSVIQLYIQLVFQLVLEKLYFENKNKLANKYCITLNLINFVVLVISALIFKNKMTIVIITLISIFIYVAIVTIKQYKKFTFNANIIRYIKYNSVDIFNSLAFFLIYLFGLNNALEYGEQFAVAITFAALITDTQWDAFASIATVANIDLSKGKFNYIEHVKNAYKLLGILLITTAIMFIALFNFYDLNLSIVFLILAIEFVNFIIYPIYNLKTRYLQLEYSSIKTATNKIISDILRMFCSFLATPYCTVIGQLCSAIYQLVSYNLIFKFNFKLKSTGEIVVKNNNQ